MAVRQYDFITGIETSTLPTVADPSAPSDIINFQYANKKYTRGIATIAAIKAIGSSDRSDNQSVFLDELTAYFYFDSASSATADDITVIQPTVGTGRWIRQERFVDPVANTDHVIWGYSQKTYTRGFASVAAIKALTATERTDNQTVWCDALQQFFFFDSAASDTGDDVHVLTPDAGTGRWIRVDSRLQAFQKRDENGTATVNALTSTKLFVKLTSGGTPVTTLNGIVAGIEGQIIKVLNQTGSNVTINHESGSASAADRMTLPNAAPLILASGLAVDFVYDSGASRWVLSGGGGTGGSYSTFSNQNISAGGSVTLSIGQGFQLRRIQGTPGAVTASTTPFGAVGGWLDGQVVTLLGQSATNTVTFVNNDAAKGAILNGNATLGSGDVLILQYDANADRFYEISRNF